jgi:BlaI family penicillinase repressor
VTNSNTQGRPLTDLQQAILDVVWSRGPVTAEQVRTALGPARHLKDSTVRTLLRRHEVRGFLAHSLSGKVFVYRAALARRGVAARAVQHIIDRFWAGSTEQFLAGMVSEKVLSLDEIRQLARKVKAHR